MRKFLIALKFLTIIPVRIKEPIEEKELAASMSYFPLVGALIAGILVIIYGAAMHFLPQMVSASLVLVGSIIITGALHLDGFLDTMDGLYGGRNKEEILAIMRDVHAGGIGIIHVVALLVIKLALLWSIAPAHFAPVLISVFALSRWSLVLACRRYPYARADGGKAKAFVELVDQRSLIIATILSAAISIFLVGFLKSAALFTSAFIAIFLFGSLLKKKIGGVTGDTLGGQNEIVEIASLIILTAWQS